MNYHSINDLVELCHKNNAQIWQVIMMDNAHERMVSEDKIFENMRVMYKAMKTADNNYDKSLKSPSRMAGGDGELMYQYNKSGRNICGDFVGMVMEKALKMGESNACMRRIVAAPTAGSCGVIPAVFISYETYFKAQKGYRCSITMSKEEKKVEFVEDFLQRDMPQAGTLHRYSFDVRA